MPSFRDTSSSWKLNLLRLLAAFAAGVCQFASYEPRGLWWAGWAASAFLIAALLPSPSSNADSASNTDASSSISETPSRSRMSAKIPWWLVIAIGFVWAATTALCSLPWIASFVGNLPWIALAVVLGILAIPTSVGIAAILASGAPWLLRGVGAAAWIVAVEALLSHWPFGGFPWLRLAWGQIDGPVRVLAVIGGAPLVSFAVALIAFAFLSLACRRLGSAITVAVALVVAIVVATPAVGSNDGEDHRSIRVAAVQGNVPRLGLEFNEQRLAVLRNHVDATIALAKRVAAGEEAEPDVVIWPENSADVSPLVDDSAARLIDRAAQAIDAPIIVGTFSYDHGTHNTMLVWDPAHGPLDGPDNRHEKIYLQPFGEYMPMRDLLRKVTDLVDLAGDMTPGTGDGVIRIAGGGGDGAAGSVSKKDLAIGVATCYEVVFDRAYRTAVNNGATILTTPTNNATFGFTDMTYQQLAMSRMRAIEHNRAVIVAATSGVSAIVMPDGSVQSQTEIFQQKVLTASVPLHTQRTTASRFGEIVEWSIAGLGLTVLTVAIMVGFLGTLRRIS